jgi:hypothetical protein
MYLNLNSNGSLIDNSYITAIGQTNSAFQGGFLMFGNYNINGLSCRLSDTNSGTSGCTFTVGKVTTPGDVFVPQSLEVTIAPGANSGTNFNSFSVAGNEMIAVLFRGKLSGLPGIAGAVNIRYSPV